MKHRGDATRLSVLSLYSLHSILLEVCIAHYKLCTSEQNKAVRTDSCWIDWFHVPLYKTLSRVSEEGLCCFIAAFQNNAQWNGPNQRFYRERALVWIRAQMNSSHLFTWKQQHSLEEIHERQQSERARIETDQRRWPLRWGISSQSKVRKSLQICLADDTAAGFLRYGVLRQTIMAALSWGRMAFIELKFINIWCSFWAISCCFLSSAAILRGDWTQRGDERRPVTHPSAHTVLSTLSRHIIANY